MGDKLHSQEWIEYINKEEGSEYSPSDCNYVLMERYANYMSREWQALILTFRNKIVLNGGMTDFSILKKFDEHFNITHDRERK